ncbi:MAG: substrate-binding domain-containing protein [Kiritimatiellae bacterium]|nr:substrate-binding domain-containing protein [Kiritimatiellia bacterium]
MKTVLVIMNMAVPAGMQRFAGITRFLAKHHHPWELIPVRTCYDCTEAVVATALASGVDGIVFAMEESLVAEGIISQCDIPTVVLDSARSAVARRRKNIAFVSNDNAAVARAAADSFLSQGVYRSYVFTPDRAECWWALDRGKAFRAYLREKGLPEPAVVPGGTPDAQFIEILSSLPKPCAVFAANDDRALEVLHICRRADLEIPSEVAILGVDDDEVVCLNTSPTLSSIALEFEEAGYRGAEILDAMMRSAAHKPRRETLFGVRKVVQRETTMPFSSAGKMVQKAVAYINAFATEGITVSDVVRHLKVSRSLADRYFRRLQKTSINNAITERRLEEIAKRLLATDEPVERLALDCGFGSIANSKECFRRKYGCSMREFRKKNK